MQVNMESTMKKVLSFRNIRCKILLISIVFNWGLRNQLLSNVIVLKHEVTNFRALQN